jgi:DNA-directed RNA polymerase subunit M
MEAQKVQKYCPRCGSVSLRWASGLPQLWSIYDCRECGYRGVLIIEDGTLAQEIRKRWLKEQEEKGRMR